MRAVALSLFILPFLPAISVAQPATCADRHEVLAQLKARFDETPVEAGLTDQGEIVELTTSENGTWTLMLSFPNGRSCLISSGENWVRATPKTTGKDA